MDILLTPSSQTFGKTFLVVTTGEILLISSGERPGMLLNILQYALQPPQERTLWPKMSVVFSEFEKNSMLELKLLR